MAVAVAVAVAVAGRLCFFKSMANDAGTVNPPGVRSVFDVPASASASASALALAAREGRTSAGGNATSTEAVTTMPS
jgi:hypothetical protein